MKSDLLCRQSRQPRESAPPLTRNRASALLIVPLSLAALSLLLVGCSNLNAALLQDSAVQATATACGCNCYLYGSYPHTTPSATPTPTGTWVAPTRTPRPTKTRPPAGCDYCTMPPAPTQAPPHWQPPIVTCTPRPDEPTMTAVPTLPPAIFPTLPPNTPLPAAIGNTAPISIGSMEGEALPGGVAAHPITGRPYLIWSQLNMDSGQENNGRVYLKLTDPKTGQWLPARTVNSPGDYKIGKGGPESAAAVGHDDTIYVVYVKAVGEEAYLEWRSSTDNGHIWTVPQTLPYPGMGMIYNVRLLVDDTNQPHIAAIAKRGLECGDETDGCGDIVYHERRPNGSWRSENRPVSGMGERQYNLAMSVFNLPDGTVRTALGWTEKHAVFTTYKDSKDGMGGAWQPPQFIIDGASRPYGIEDYWPGWTGIQMLTFEHDDQRWVYLFWSLYSTGRICYVYSSDGGVTWSEEDAMAYNQAVPVPDPGTPFVPPTVWGGAYEPVPFWDGEHERIFVVYRFRSRSIDNPSGEFFPAFAYGRPGDPGHDWIGYQSNTAEPLRLFPPTMANSSRSYRGNDQHGTGRSPVYLMWLEPTGSKELYFASISPATLLSGIGLP
jgi:hypothetical protein